MKPAAFTPLLILIASFSHAQFTLTPQVGFERSRTTIDFNDNSFSPLGGKGSIKANLRLDYKFKMGHGPFIGLGTSPATTSFRFAQVSSALNNYKASTNSLQWRLEAGYQYRTKPIVFNKKSVTGNTKASKNTQEKKACGAYNHCGSQRKTQPAKNPLFNMRLQPSMGLAYIPSTGKDLVAKDNLTQYNAGNWKTALITGLGFEFGRGKERILTLGITYTKGLGIQERTVSTMENGKPYSAVLESNNSSWGMTIGVPFSLAKQKKPAAKQQQQKKTSCGSRTEVYRYRCIKQI